MAYSAQYNATFSNRTNHRIETYIRRDGVSGNSSTYWWQLAARRTSGAVSFVNNAQPWWVYNGRAVVPGSSGLPFSSSVSVLILGSGYSGWIAHNSSGYLNIWVDGKMEASLFGNAYGGGTFITDRILQVPSKPVNPVILDVGTTDVLFRITSPNNGGTAIREYQMQISNSPNWPGSGSSIIDSWMSGASNQARGGLPVGTQLYVRYRARNDVGWGPFSNGVGFKTKSGVFVGAGGSFPGAEVLVGSGGSFVVAEIWVPDEATETWVLAGS